MQQVNLLAQDLRVGSEPLVASHFLVVWAGFVVVLGMLSAWQGVSLWSLQGEKASTAEALDVLRAENEIQRQAGAEPVGLKTRVAELAAEQQRQQQLLALLRSEQETRGFSTYLKSLAASRVDGLWLESIRISHGSQRQVRLSGAAKDAQFVPQLLFNLAEEEPFAGQRFESLQLEASDELIKFELFNPEAGV